MEVLELRKEGWYCPAGDFYIDPKRQVERAIVTHAHSDHAKPGMKSYLCHPLSKSVLKLRLGKNIVIQTLPYGEKLTIGKARISFHPAGHIPGSAMVKIDVDGERWVVSGDYKTNPDGLSTPFEPVQCETFITESTFGLPVFQWPDQETVLAQILSWIELCFENQTVPCLQGYSLGKLQRLMALLNGKFPLFLHPILQQVNEALCQDGLSLPSGNSFKSLSEVKMKKGILLSPVSPSGDNFHRVETAFFSGWVAVRGLKGEKKSEKGFLISDHADWNGLLILKRIFQLIL
jgi:putative mRNA 3-end processing factor